MNTIPSTPPEYPPVLCVSIHDVAPATWARCARLIGAVTAVRPVPLTLLVVPNHHHAGEELPAWYHDALELRYRAGDELALHGYVHVDEAATPHNPADWWRRRVLTAGEGEFAALPAQEASTRLAAGLAWFRRQGWTPRGFIPPAWLLSAGSWQALEASPFTYATTAGAFHLLHPRRRLRTRCFAYSTRSGLRRSLSLGWNGLRQPLLWDQPVRLALHPDDALQPKVLAQIQRFLEGLLKNRVALTKAGLASLLEAALQVPPSHGGGTRARDASATPPPRATPASTSLG